MHFLNYRRSNKITSSLNHHGPSIKIKRIWTILFLIINGFVALKFTESSSLAASPEREKAVQLRGLMEVKQGDKYITLIAISADDTAVSGWLKAGSTWRQFTIVEASAKNGYAVIRGLGTDQKITLEQQVVGKLEDSLYDPTKSMTTARTLDWRWIKSDENPMKKQAFDLPPEIVLKWSILSDSEKEKIRDTYWRHGFELTVEVKPPLINVDYSRIRDPSEPIDRSKQGPAPKLLQLK